MPGPKQDRPPLPRRANRPKTLGDPSLTDAELHEAQRKKGDPVIGHGPDGDTDTPADQRKR
ncbi:hypothetical protein [Sphingomonas oryzagri]|jgi:hypothetical protein|uniref:Uncharacterized protein n=1 Tax=Sphingomonas oryzagri TaxID=3042314 RepID=A0ABT6MYU2_9SPHN|nr:hypothetical protein [Sphingomonas oryzagri]MDH7638235.1 hypothetical protein [Sphingomonas oryzagri]